MWLGRLLEAQRCSFHNKSSNFILKCTEKYLTNNFKTKSRTNVSCLWIEKKSEQNLMRKMAFSVKSCVNAEAKTELVKLKAIKQYLKANNEKPQHQQKHKISKVE